MPKLQLNEKQIAFAREYVVDFNATQAAIRAGYSRHTAGAIGHDLLKKAEIQAEVEKLRAAMASRSDATADDVLRMWWETATADPNELMQHRVGACRYCWGDDHAFQWRSQREYDQSTEAYLAGKAANKKGLVAPAGSEGGVGYRRTAAPNPDCPECEGLGASFTVFTDTTKLSPQARLLYNGVKQTQHGLEIVFADRQKALEHVARRMGLLKEQVEHDVTGPMKAFLEAIRSGGSAAPMGSPSTAANDE